MSDFQKAKRRVMTKDGYKLLSYATSSESVEMVDGTDLQTDINAVKTNINTKVPNTRTINGKVLSDNITLTASDIGADASGSADDALNSAKSYTDGKIDAIVGEGASTTLDTIGEISKAIEEHQDVTDALNSAIGNKVDKVDGKGLSTNDYTTEEKTKLSGIATGAEVNQNAFGKVKIGSTTISADAKVDTLTLVAGDNVTITPDATNDKITISSTGGSNVKVDNILSNTSENPVQNKVVTDAITTTDEYLSDYSGGFIGYTEPINRATAMTVLKGHETVMSKMASDIVSIKKNSSGVKVVDITQADYDALENKQDGVLYNIIDADEYIKAENVEYGVSDVKTVLDDTMKMSKIVRFQGTTASTQSVKANSTALISISDSMIAYDILGNELPSKPKNVRPLGITYFDIGDIHLTSQSIYVSTDASGDFGIFSYVKNNSNSDINITVSGAFVGYVLDED